MDDPLAPETFSSSTSFETELFFSFKAPEVGEMMYSFHIDCLSALSGMGDKEPDWHSYGMTRDSPTPGKESKLSEPIPTLPDKVGEPRKSGEGSKTSSYKK